MRVGVIGGGIGGLCTAVALAKFGVDVHVFEQAQQLREVGAGIGVGPNAVKVLRALGLEEELNRRAFQAERFEGRDWTTGQVLFQTPMKGVSQARYGAGHYQIHRADLLRILSDAIARDRVSLDAKCVSVHSSGSSAHAVFADGQVRAFDLLVGADGLHSVVRTELHGNLAPRFTGHMCWRALIQSVALPPNHVPPQMTIWKGPGGHVVTYLLRGGTIVNVVAFHSVAEFVEESWTTESSGAELAAAYVGVHPDLRLVLERAEQCFKWGLYDRDPLPHWGAARLTLVGDAAHPMLPFLGQGAACAIEDGYVLAAELARTPDDHVAALRRYEELRIPRTARIQLAARQQERFAHQATRSADVNSDWLYEFDAVEGSN
jgi:salicylate hydroxylase